MAFAPRPTKPKVRPHHKVPRIEIPNRSSSTGIRKKLHNWEDVEHPTGRQLTKMCWLCRVECDNYGWVGQSRHLQDPCPLNLITLCAGCSALSGESKLTNTQIADAVGHRHSDAFITFVREYRVLLELIGVEKQRVNIARCDPSSSHVNIPRPYHDLATLRKLLTCVDSALSTRGLIAGEKMLLREELANLQEQVQVHHSGGEKSTPAHTHKTTPRSRSPVASGRPRRISAPRPGITNESKDDPPPVISDPNLREETGPSLAVHIQHEMSRLHASNNDALQKLATLTEQHKQLAADHAEKVRENESLKAYNEQLVSQQQETLDYVEALELETKTLKEDLAALRTRSRREEDKISHDDTTRIIKDLRARVDLAESQLSHRPEASREEILMSVDSRRSAIAEAQQLRVANGHIGERLLVVEQQLISQQQENSSMRQQLRRTSAQSESGSLHTLMNEVAPLTAQLNSRLQSATPTPVPLFSKHVESEHDFQSHSTSPVRQRDYAPSPKVHPEVRTSPPPQRNVVWADAFGNTVSFQMDPNAEREEF